MKGAIMFHTGGVLNVHRFGDPANPTILALHGLTGHGRRWEDLATNHLADFHVIAPDLRGHGRSPWVPPWCLEDVSGDLVDLLESPAIVIGHSFGGAVALHLAHAHPELVKALVLLDPAIGLDPELVLDHVTGAIRSPDYAGVDEARRDKTSGSWGEVPTELLDAEVAEHLVTYDNGRVGWRLCVPAMAAFYGELARPLVLPSSPTTVVRALKVNPPYANKALINGLEAHLGDAFTLQEWDCDHMVPQARPAEVAALIRKVASAL